MLLSQIPRKNLCQRFALSTCTVILREFVVKLFVVILKGRDLSAPTPPRPMEVQEITPQVRKV
jgi:hypothetical protein